MEKQVSIADLLRAARALKPLTLEALSELTPFRSEVWIEQRPWATLKVTEESEVYRFFLLFPAVFAVIGIPSGNERRRFHFSYTYNDGRKYNFCRVDEFYGQEWRVWAERPTEEERRATPWNSRWWEEERR